MDQISQDEEERRALHVAIQNVVRDFEDEGVITGCVLTYEVKTPTGRTYLAHRTFNIEGERLASWTAEGFLRDHLRMQNMRAVHGLTSEPEEGDDDGT